MLRAWRDEPAGQIVHEGIISSSVDSRDSRIDSSFPGPKAFRIQGMILEGRRDENFRLYGERAGWGGKKGEGNAFSRWGSSGIRDGGVGRVGGIVGVRERNKGASLPRDAEWKYNEREEKNRISSARIYSHLGALWKALVGICN